MVFVTLFGTRKRGSEVVVYHFCCENKHKFAIDLMISKYESFLDKCQKLKRVCPHCHPNNVRIFPYEPDFLNGVTRKDFVCKHGHITSAIVLGDYINFSWIKDEFENIYLQPEEVVDYLKAGNLKCRNKIVGEKNNIRKCNCKLKPIDDAILVRNTGSNIKTRVLVGDVWDKYKCPEPKESYYDFSKSDGEIDSEFVETEFSKRNKRRLAKIRTERLNKPAGEIMKKPTNNTYFDKKPRKPSNKEIKEGL